MCYPDGFSLTCLSLYQPFPNTSHPSMFFVDGTIRCGSWWYRCFTVGSLVGPSCPSSFKGLDLCRIFFAKASSDLYSTGWWWEGRSWCKGSGFGEFCPETGSTFCYSRGSRVEFVDKWLVWVEISEVKWYRAQRCLQMFPHRYQGSRKDYRRLGTSWNCKLMYNHVCIVFIICFHNICNFMAEMSIVLGTVALNLPLILR